MTYYVSKNDQKLGPYSVEQIQIFIRNGLVTSDSLVWAEGWSNWVPIQAVAEFASEFQQPSSTPIASTSANPTSDATRDSSAYVQGKEPVVACVLSLVIVGSGQAYNGEWAKGIVLMVTCIIAAWFSCGTFWLVWALVSAIDAYRVAARLKTANNWNWWA